VQLIKGNTFAGTAFGSYGCFWLGWFFWRFLEIDSIVPGVVNVSEIK
jgi:succinate-acetate transporter protein